MVELDFLEINAQSIRIGQLQKKLFTFSTPASEITSYLHATFCWYWNSFQEYGHSNILRCVIVATVTM